jgi:hypothetical protein
MTDEILGYIYEHFKLTTAEEKNAFILSLIPEARKLWGSYQNGLVKYDYDTELAQIVYLLRYYLPYAKPIQEILEHLKTSEFDHFLTPLTTSTDLDIAFFGAGPAPELYGFLDYIHNNDWSAKSITAHLFDEKKWSVARKITKENILSKILQRVPRKNRDLLTADWEWTFDCPVKPDGWEFLSKCKLIWFQNCFNESEVEEIVSFICNIPYEIASESLIILVDLTRTMSDTLRFKEICNGIIKDDFVVKYSNLTLLRNMEPLCISNYDLNSRLSLDLKNKLFYVGQYATPETSGLILKNRFEYNYAVFRKE